MILFLSFLTALLPLLTVLVKREFSPEFQREKKQKEINDAIGSGAAGVDRVNRILRRM